MSILPNPYGNPYGWGNPYASSIYGGGYGGGFGYPVPMPRTQVIPMPFPMSGMDTTTGQRNVDLNKLAGEPTLKLASDEKLEDGRVIGKDAPIGIPRVLGGLTDALAGTVGIKTDFDQRGTRKGESSVSGYGRTPTLADYQMPVVRPPTVSNPYLGGQAVPSPGNYGEVIRQYGGDMRKFHRGMRRDAAIDAFGQYVATEPIRQRFLNKAAEDTLQRGMRLRAWKEGLPSSVQALMASKQDQQSKASSAWGDELRAVATAQTAANNFGAPAATIGRRFGR
tara:strand:+ start:373 stop:1212 length:840 start_codon:yes stop_codon:yes gene_type:complete